jgi:hypothetical protein
MNRHSKANVDPGRAVAKGCFRMVHQFDSVRLFRDGKPSTPATTESDAPPALPADVSRDDLRVPAN